MVSTTIDTLAKLRAVFVLLTAASCVMALHGIGQAADDLATGWTGAVMIEGRITYLGFLNDPNDLARSMLMTLPMCLHMAHGRGFSLRWMFRAAALLILYGVYLTNSRGAILAVGSMLLIYCTRRYGLWRGLILVPLLAAPMVLLAPSRIGEISAEEDSAAGRVEAWYEGFQMLRSHPLFGVGKGQFTDHHTLTAHNSYVLALAELGIVGYFVWLSIIILTVMMLWALVRSGDPTPRNDASAVPDMPSTSWAVPAVPAMPMLQGERGTTEIDTWDDCQRSARTLFYGMVGILVSAYFLSRSYVVILYLQIALAVAVHQLARAHWPTFPRVLFGPMWGKLAMISVASAFFLWLVTRVLL